MKLFGETYQFADAWVLWFLLIIPILVFWYMHYGKETLTFKTSLIPSGVTKHSRGAEYIKPIKFALRLIALSLMIIALARPQMSAESPSYIEQYKEGIDIVIALDASGSMLAKDFEPDRFEASKSVAQEFISSRPNDRIGLVIFEGEAYTQCPLTGDKDIIIELLGDAEMQVVTPGTAIGMGLATAVNRLRDSEAVSKVIILLTDGVNTHGKIHPLAAAEMAKEFGIRVYTIGVGTNGKAKTPVSINPFNGEYVYDYVDVEIDEETLKNIAASTGGKYFRATDNEKLKEIYQEIDQMEKAKIETIEYEIDLPEKSMIVIMLSLGLLGIELLINLFFRSLS
ncbi:MAG: VWA domain-containing protein [Flavobacteriales bacterium]|nr:VWA domain-containing protein [Flavobacteriales bacterium]MCB9196349.1 VWA domain-containing protein [Flavobacteriales bacterium]